MNRLARFTAGFVLAMTATMGTAAAASQTLTVRPSCPIASTGAFNPCAVLDVTQTEAAN